MIVVVLTILSIILKCIAVGVIQRQRPAFTYFDSLLMSSIIMVVLVYIDALWFISQSKTGVVSTRHSPFPSIWFIITVAALMTTCSPMHL